MRMTENTKIGIFFFCFIYNLRVSIFNAIYMSVRK